MKELFRSIFRNNKPLNTGALLDNRKPDEKINDIKFGDIVATANAANWGTKDPSEYRHFPDLNQYQSYMCGANALSKVWGIYLKQKYGRYVQLSRADIYQRRINRPGEGMYLYDMFRIASEGATLEELTNEDVHTDQQADSVMIDALQRSVGNGFAISTAVYLPNDIDAIASVIQTTGKGVILLTYFISAEWSQYTPTIQNRLMSATDPVALRHFVAAVGSTLSNGQKCLVIEDSAWFGGLNRRLVTEDWVRTRVIAAAYPMTFKYGTSGDKPQYDGVTIISAQRCLQYDGCFPNNVNFADNWGPVSRRSALQFQQKYGLPQTGLLDDATKIKLHQLYP